MLPKCQNFDKSGLTDRKYLWRLSSGGGGVRRLMVMVTDPEMKSRMRPKWR